MLNSNLKAIEEKIVELTHRLQSAYIVPVNQENLNSIKKCIAGLLVDATEYVNKTHPGMTPWQKDHVVEAINALYWGWLNLALTEIELLIIDPSTVAPENKYKDEVVKLSYDELISHVSNIKDLLEKK